MKNLIAVMVLSALLLAGADAYAKRYDAGDGFDCDEAANSAWSYEAFRAGDGVYLPLIFGRADVIELSKYGMDAMYLPDGDQPYYPFIAKFPDSLRASPATEGRTFDAVVTWTSPEDCEAQVTGTMEIVGSMLGGPEGKRISAKLVNGEDVLWSGEVTGDAPVGFSVRSSVAAGEKLRLHLVNMDGTGGKLTTLNMSVDTM